MGGEIAKRGVFLYWTATQDTLKQANINYKMFSNSLPIIELRNKGHSLQNKSYLNG